MNLQTILEKQLVGKKILSHERIDLNNIKVDDKPINNIITIHNIDEIKNGKMKVTCTIHSLDHKNSDFYGYPLRNN